MAPAYDFSNVVRTRLNPISRAFRRILACATLAAMAQHATAAITIPGSTAYLEPLENSVRVGRNGVRSWTDTNTSILWFGKLGHGDLDCQVRLSSTGETPPLLQLTVAGITRPGEFKRNGTNDVVDFGKFSISSPGFQKFVLKQTGGSPLPANAVVNALLLDGPATNGSHFNEVERRNAASVHLAYPTSGLTNITKFYCEVTGVEDPLWTFYMACGWHRGYFGMQVISPTERRIIFSVWDSGNEAVERAKVQAEDRVTLVGKGDGVYSGDFGNEGTGGHSHLKFLWKTGEKQRFLMTAEPVDATHTIYTGYYFRPDQKRWMLISSWKAPKEGGYPRGLHSFSENFVGDNGHLVRKALFGHQWVQTADGKWTELLKASFSHDATGKADRIDRFMGIENGQFFLSHGGFVPGYTRFGEKFTRSATGTPPADLDLPKVADGEPK